MSLIITARLKVFLKKRGTKSQFGCTTNTGCQHVSFLLRTILQTRKEHNLDTYGVFVDLVKAFDTVNHTLLYMILSKFGIPRKVFTMIKKLYTNNIVRFNIGKEHRDVPYTTGVKQGNNLTPTLFIIVMQAMEEIF